MLLKGLIAYLIFNEAPNELKVQDVLNIYKDTGPVHEGYQMELEGKCLFATLGCQLWYSFFSSGWMWWYQKW